ADGIVQTSEPAVHRRDHTPASPVSGVFLQMLLDLGDEIFERLRSSGRAAALGQRKIGQTGRTKRAIEPNRNDGQPEESHNGSEPAQGDIRSRRSPLIV